MYEPDSSSSSFSVVTSTSRSPQSSQNGTEPVGADAWTNTKPTHEYGHGKSEGNGGGSPTITTNTNGQDNDAGMLFMDHDNGGHDHEQTQLHWIGSGNGHKGHGMDALKKEALKAFEASKMGQPAPSDRADTNGGNNGETPTTTTTLNTNGGPMVASDQTPSSSSGNSKAAAQEQPEQSSNLSSTQNSDSPTKTKPPKLCQVCGDKAKSFHFGGLSCDSCKAFFRRSVHNDAYKGFHCVYQRNCEISISSRKSCQACRFKKCLAIGMETNWVMTEEERSQLQKQRSEKKESGLAASGKGPVAASASISRPGPTPIAAPAAANEDDAELNFEPSVADMLSYMTAEERDEIESIVNKYQHSYREIPFRVPNSSGTRKTVEIIQMFTTILRRFAYFTKLIPEFAGLVHSDQSTLLRAGVLEMCLLRSALAFDTKNNRWPKTENMEFLKDCPQLRVEDMEKLVSKDLYHMHMQFINGIQELRVDEPTVMILLLIVLFYPERGPLEQQELISKVQEKYLLLLNKYVQWRFGPRAGKVFPKLLTRLADLRQLNDFHTEYNLKMTKTEVEEIQEQLGNINLNPYPQWVLVDQQQKAAVAAAAASHLGVTVGGGGMHSAHAYADTSADADQLSPHGHGHGHESLYTPSPEAGEGEYAALPMQDIHMQGLPEMQQSHPQMMNYGAGLMPMPMPYAANAGAPRQFPSAAANTAGGGMSQMPNMRQLFMQFVNNRIPALITNPFAAFPMDNELSGAAAFFEQMSAGGGGAPSMQQIQSLMAAGGGMGIGQVGQDGGGGVSMASMGIGMGEQHQQHLHMSGGGGMPPDGPATEVTGSGTQAQAPISQICNILESSDPNTLRQLKEYLSPGMVAKLSSIFGAGGVVSTGGGGMAELMSSGSFDLSKIPPELIQSFLGGGGGEGSNAAVAGGMMSGVDPGLANCASGMSGYQHQQYAAGAGGYSSGGYTQLQQQDQNAYQHELDLSASNWGGIASGQAPAQVVPDQHQLQQPILVGGHGHAGAVDFTSASFLTHRQQAQHQQPHHFDTSPTDGSGARYGNGGHW